MRVAAKSSAERKVGEAESRAIGMLRGLHIGVDDVRLELNVARKSVDDLRANLSAWQRELKAVVGTMTSARNAEFS